MSLTFPDPRPRAAGAITDFDAVVWDAVDENGKRVLCTIEWRAIEDSEPGLSIANEVDALAAWHRHERRIGAQASALHTALIGQGAPLRLRDGYPVVDLMTKRGM